MSTSDPARDRTTERLEKAEKPTGRQDLIAPPPTTEPSDPTRVDVRRGQRLWLGFLAVAVVFIVIIGIIWVTN